MQNWKEQSVDSDQKCGQFEILLYFRVDAREGLGGKRVYEGCEQVNDQVDPSVP